MQRKLRSEREASAREYCNHCSSNSVGHPLCSRGCHAVFFYQSHWTLFVGAAQIVIGILLLTNRFVPVALIMLAAFIYNSFAFHITMLPQGLFAPVIVLILGYIVARPYSGLFAPLFRPQPLRTQREP